METWSLKVFWKEKNTVIVVTDAKNDSANEGFPGGSDGKESDCSAGDPGSVPGREDPLEEGMAIHSSILAWRTPWTEEPGGPQFMGHRESDTTERLTLSYFHRELDGEWEISVKLSDQRNAKGILINLRENDLGFRIRQNTKRSSLHL